MLLPFFTTFCFLQCGQFILPSLFSRHQCQYLFSNPLLQPTKFKGTDDDKATVRVKLDVTSASPGPPPREGATRPFLAVYNGFERPLHYRALVRLKGSKEFFEISEGVEPLPPAEERNKCWEFDSLVEEVVLFEFTLSEKPAK